MATYARPYLRSLKINLHAFTAKATPTNQFGAALDPVYGAQEPMLSVDLELYLGQSSIGTQKYIFGAKPTPASLQHEGLPSYREIVTKEVQAAWESAFTEAIDSQMEEFEDESPEAQASGPEFYLRVNRIEASLPYDKPDERYVAAIIGVYEDSAFTRQVIDADFAVCFVSDGFVKLRLGVAQGQEVAQEQIAMLRSAKRWYVLKDFLTKPAVGQSVGSMATALFTVLTTKVFNYKKATVAGIMQNFSIPLE